MGIVADGRVRAKGAGRPVVERSDPLRWTAKSTAILAAELAAGGHRISAKTVARLLKDHGFSLRANVKTLAGKQHPDRDGQFRYISTQASVFLASGQPVISVDTKKKLLVGADKADGRECARAGEPAVVDSYHVTGVGGRVAPYGMFVVASNVGWVNVGTDADTGTFTVESIRRWWDRMGRAAYPGASQLLITLDGSGSNGSRKVGAAKKATKKAVTKAKRKVGKAAKKK